ncbi:MAG TPA: hypothetical protein ENH43_02470 [Phycisphaerales bacterium]|nr:hypothetical protein [Phycisphaerales bacterium]
MRTFGVWQAGRNRHSNNYSDAGRLLSRRQKSELRLALRKSAWGRLTATATGTETGKTVSLSKKAKVKT